MRVRASGLRVEIIRDGTRELVHVLGWVESSARHLVQLPGEGGVALVDFRALEARTQRPHRIMPPAGRAFDAPATAAAAAASPADGAQKELGEAGDADAASEANVKGRGKWARAHKIASLERRVGKCASA